MMDLHVGGREREGTKRLGVLRKEKREKIEERIGD